MLSHTVHIVHKIYRVSKTKGWVLFLRNEYSLISKCSKDDVRVDIMNDIYVSS